MGRPSVLTEPMKVEIATRIAQGEPIRALAREFKVAEGTLRNNFSTHAPRIKNVAVALKSAEQDLASMPVFAQRAAINLKEHLKAIEGHYATAAEAGARSSARLHNLADRYSERLVRRAEEEDGLDPKDVAVVAALHDTANKGAQMASNLIAANKSSTPASPPELFINTGVPREG